MSKKIIILVILFCCGVAMPSYTNSCAKPGAAFLEAAQETVKQDHAMKTARSKAHGLEVFPLDIISIQL